MRSEDGMRIKPPLAVLEEIIELLLSHLGTAIAAAPSMNRDVLLGDALETAVRTGFVDDEDVVVLLSSHYIF